LFYISKPRSYTILVDVPIENFDKAIKVFQKTKSFFGFIDNLKKVGKIQVINGVL